MKRRFSKPAMRALLEARIDLITRTWEFEPPDANGTAQLKGRSPEAWLAYGQRDAYAALLEDLEGKGL